MTLQRGGIPLSLVYFYHLQPFAWWPVLSIIHQAVIHKRYDVGSIESCTLNSITIQVTSCCHVFDYSGIVVLIVGSFYPSIYYGFFCDSHVQAFYLSTITIAGLGKIMILLIL